MNSYSQPSAEMTHEFSRVEMWGHGATDGPFVFVDSDSVVVSPQDVVNMCRSHGMSLRGAAEYFGTSPSKLQRFMRKNGYRLSRTTEIGYEEGGR